MRGERVLRSQLIGDLQRERGIEPAMPVDRRKLGPLSFGVRRKLDASRA